MGGGCIYGWGMYGLRGGGCIYGRGMYGLRGEEGYGLLWGYVVRVGYPCSISSAFSIRVSSLRAPVHLVKMEPLALMNMVVGRPRTA